jgi:hypothetical protein
MPRKAKNPIEKTEKKSKKNLMNTMVKNISVEDEDIILQLPLSDNDINKINQNNDINNVEILNNDSMQIPVAYDPLCFYINDNLEIEEDNLCNIEVTEQPELNQYSVNINSTNNCYWCCHSIKEHIYGMPTKYNSLNDTYMTYGTFCSLQCANAYNFSVHSGTDKVWEINSFIQMVGKSYGYKEQIRPAPSRYLLKLFNGNMTIDEFRNSHIKYDKAYLLNIQPMISLATSHEVINTSYLKNVIDNINYVKQKQTNNVPIKKNISKNTIDTKLNLIIS